MLVCVGVPCTWKTSLYSASRGLEGWAEGILRSTVVWYVANGTTPRPETLNSKPANIPSRILTWQWKISMNGGFYLGNHLFLWSIFQHAMEGISNMFKTWFSQVFGDSHWVHPCIQRIWIFQWSRRLWWKTWAKQSMPCQFRWINPGDPWAPSKWQIWSVWSHFTH